MDWTSYLGAFVTPNVPEVMSYLRKAIEKQPNKRLVGYQVAPGKAAAGEKIDKKEVTSEVKAIYEFLADTGITYINSIIDFTPEIGTANNQRVRVPRESLADRSANCIDGTVLMASLLEGISLNPAIVIVPGHAFLGWETWKNNSEWRYVETTMVSTNSFEDACTQADQTAVKWQALDNGAKQCLSAGRFAISARWELLHSSRTPVNSLVAHAALQRCIADLDAAVFHLDLDQDALTVRLTQADLEAIDFDGVLRRSADRLRSVIEDPATSPKLRTRAEKALVELYVRVVSHARAEAA